MADGGVPAGGRRVVVLGPDAAAVAGAVGRAREAGDRAVGFVGEDEQVAREMAEEMLGGVDEVVLVPRGGPGEASA